MIRAKALGIIFIILIGGSLYASPDEMNNPDSIDSKVSIEELFPESKTKSRELVPWRLGVFGATSLGIAGYAFSRMDDWWGESTGEPHIKHTDWKGDNLAQTDEISHFFLSYKITQTGTHFARWTGLSDKASRFIGAGMALTIMTWVEYPVDTYNPYQGFGYTDMIANAIGISLATTRDIWPEYMHYFDFRFSFKYNQEMPSELIAQTTAENDAYIYWLTVNPVDKFPIHAALGYSSNHLAEDREVEREVYIGFGTSLAEIAGMINPKYRKKLDLWNAYELSINFRID